MDTNQAILETIAEMMLEDPEVDPYFDMVQWAKFVDRFAARVGKDAARIEFTMGDFKFVKLTIEHAKKVLRVPGAVMRVRGAGYHYYPDGSEVRIVGESYFADFIVEIVDNDKVRDRYGCQHIQDEDLY